MYILIIILNFKISKVYLIFWISIKYQTFFVSMNESILSYKRSHNFWTTSYYLIILLYNVNITIKKNSRNHSNVRGGKGE